jgi:alkylation response protein AidB-like acyl-CoA dehydrogenase
MNFSVTEEQQLLRDALERFIQKSYSFEKRRTIMASSTGWSREVWQGLAELGVLGVAVPQEHGGYGGTMADAAIVAEVLGEGLVVEPFMATCVLGVGAVLRCASAAQRTRILPGVLRGETVLALAHSEGGSAIAGKTLQTTANPAASGYVLNGAKSLVLHGAQADQVLVSARLEGSPGAPVCLFLVPAGTQGLSRSDRRTVDGLRAAHLVLDSVAVPATALLGEGADCSPGIDRVLDRAAAASCAEAVGVMQRLHLQTLDYIKTRQQFGQPIGRFQVLQHRAADMYMLLEQSRSMAWLAAARADDEDDNRRRAAVSAAKAYIGRCGRWVAQAAIQMHGGIGMTDELPASHYAKRLTMLDFWFGTGEDHVQRFLSTDRP